MCVDLAVGVLAACVRGVDCVIACVREFARRSNPLAGISEASHKRVTKTHTAPSVADHFPQMSQ